MHILLVADGRSVITLRWLEGIAALGHRISLVSTFPCDKPQNISHFQVIPVAFSKLAGGQVALQSHQPRKTGGKKLSNQFRGLLLSLRYILGPSTIPFYARRFVQFVNQVKPDLVHALRIPFEGMLASYTPPEYALIVSIWGNDLILHARGSRLMGGWTRRTLQRAQGLLADAQRDMHLARDWGLADTAPALVVPGNGGVPLQEIDRLKRASRKKPSYLPEGKVFVINPRGFRPGSVHNETFFQAVPQVLKAVPQAHFLCPAMQGQPQAERWLRELQLAEHVTLLPYLPQEQLWDLFFRSQVYVSLSSHDGTPNTFLEAIACGCFPLLGDIASLREWVTSDQNGFLVDPRDVNASAQALIQALQDSALRQGAVVRNHQLVHERATTEVVRKQVAAFLLQFD